MKRNRKSNNPSKKRAKRPAGSDPEPEPMGLFGLSRRTVLGGVATLGVGLALTHYVQGEIHDHDLERIHNGRPTIVQIHDPQCHQCRRLQDQVHQALDMLETKNLDYVVANIKTTQGLTFANRHRVQHVTLLLFDRDGTLKHTLRGQRSAPELANVFQSLL